MVRVNARDPPAAGEMGFDRKGGDALERESFLTRVADAAGCDPKTAQSVYRAFVEELSRALCCGEEVDLSPEFARFQVKYSEHPGLNANSPRTPKASRYTVRVRAGKELEKRLNASPSRAEGKNSG